MTRLSLCLLALVVLIGAGTFARAGPVVAYKPNIVVSGPDPTAYEVGGDPAYNGVVRVQVGYVPASTPNATPTRGVVGTGSVLYDGNHILTAAHLFSAGAFFDPNELYIPKQSRIFLPSGAVFSTSWNIHPDWDISGPASFLNGADIALILLPDQVADTTTRYKPYCGSDEIGKVHTKVGIGLGGIGSTGTTLPIGTLRAGNNIYDTLLDPLIEVPGFWGPGTLVPGVDFVPGSLLSYDFDNGLAANDVHGYVDDWLQTYDPGGGWTWTTMPGWYDTGLGLDEINAASGDSGGPTFIDGKIAGVTSINWFWVDGVNPDGSLIGGGPDFDLIAGNSSWGEAGADTRVSMYCQWIRSNVPEPGTFLLLSVGLTMVAGAALRRRRRRS